jgi:hypothetical protein
MPTPLEIIREEFIRSGPHWNPTDEDSLAGLNPFERLVRIIEWLRGMTEHGSLISWYANGPGEHANETIAACELIGEEESAQIIRLFLSHIPGIDTNPRARSEYLASRTRNSDESFDDELTERLRQRHSKLVECLARWIVENADQRPAEADDKADQHFVQNEFDRCCENWIGSPTEDFPGMSAYERSVILLVYFETQVGSSGVSGWFGSRGGAYANEILKLCEEIGDVQTAGRLREFLSFIPGYALMNDSERYDFHMRAPQSLETFASGFAVSDAFFAKLADWIRRNPDRQN